MHIEERGRSVPASLSAGSTQGGAGRSVIVVGAGLSGLSAAALLARRGIEVLVLEASDRPGGSCSAFRRGDITYDTGAAMLFGFGERGFNPHRWLMETLGEPIEVYRHESLYRLNYGDKPITFHLEVGRFVEELASLFPDSKAEIEAFYRMLTDLYDRVISKVAVFEAPDDVPAAVMRQRVSGDPAAQFKMIGLMFRNTESLMRPWIHNPAVRRFFDKLTSTYCYTTLPETPAILAATMFVDNHVGGSWYPAGSAMSLSARLEKAIESAGGRIRYRSRVAALAAPPKPGSAPGVRLESGEMLYADAILYTGAVRALAEAPDPESILPARWRRRTLARVDSFPSFVVYGTVERSILPEGLLPVEMFIDNRENLDEGDVTLYVPSLEDPRLAPGNLAVFELIGPTFRSWPRPGEAGYGTAEYRQAKSEEADRMLALVDRRIPGFVSAMRSRIEGSPSTIERYLGKPRGSVAGPKQKMGQHILFRQRSRSPVHGLYFAGEGTVMGTGTPAVTVSGISAANRILRDFGLPAWDSAANPTTSGKGTAPDAAQGAAQASAIRVIARGKAGNLPVDGAGRLASRCRWCEHPACTAACPAAADIPGLMRRLEHGNRAGFLVTARSCARQGMAQDSLFAACSSCPAENPPCQRSCILDTAVQIRNIILDAGGFPG